MKIKFLIFSILLISFTNCDINDDSDQIICTEQYVFGLNITLKDATTSTIITSDVEVVAKDGDYEETLMTIEGIGSFFGAGERPGTYIVTVTSANYETFTSDPITLTSDVCHVIPKAFEFLLQPK